MTEPGQFPFLGATPMPATPPDSPERPWRRPASIGIRLPAPWLHCAEAAERRIMEIVVAAGARGTARLH
jgi:hypothetical protein